MNWLKRRLRIWAFSSDGIEQGQTNKAPRGLVVSQDDPGETLSTEPMRLSIYRANGGMIVETRVYDRQKDRSQNQLHIVGHDEDLGHSIAKIITMESLRG
jgi:hypothetical protein